MHRKQLKKSQIKFVAIKFPLDLVMTIDKLCGKKITRTAFVLEACRNQVEAQHRAFQKRVADMIEKAIMVNGK